MTSLLPTAALLAGTLLPAGPAVALGPPPVQDAEDVEGTEGTEGTEGFDGAEAPHPPRADEWARVSGIAAVVDGELVTWPELDEYLRRVRAQVPAETEAEVQALATELLQNMVQFELQARAGLELDIPLEAIDASLDASLSDQLDDAGAVAYGRSLRDRGQDPLQQLRDQRKDWLRSLFVQRVQGIPSPIGQRAIADDFVRPGELRAAYVDQRDLLGEPPAVRLQILDVQAAAVGGMEFALSDAQQYRDLFLAGETEFSELVRNYGAKYRDTDGRIDWTPIDQVSDPTLRAFLRDAEVGEVSEPLPSYERSEPSGYQLVLMTDRQAGSPPPAFDADGLQSDLAERLLKARRDRLQARADDGLRQRAYIWVHPALDPQRGR